MTLPPVKLPSDGDGQLSQGYCTFEMAADPAEVARCFAVLGQCAS